VVWNATDWHEKVTDFRAHGHNFVLALDISPGSTRIATGSIHNTLCVWSLLTGQRLIRTRVTRRSQSNCQIIATAISQSTISTFSSSGHSQDGAFATQAISHWHPMTGSSQPPGLRRCHSGTLQPTNSLRQSQCLTPIPSRPWPSHQTTT
jgi:hypothetical protein